MGRWIEARRTAAALWPTIWTIGHAVTGIGGVAAFLILGLFDLSDIWRWVIAGLVVAAVLLARGFHQLRMRLDAHTFLDTFRPKLAGYVNELSKLLNKYSSDWRVEWENARKDLLTDIEKLVDSSMRRRYPIAARQLSAWRDAGAHDATRVNGDQEFNERNREIAMWRSAIQECLEYQEAIRSRYPMSPTDRAR